jgi:hypothetical protein
MLVHRDDQLHDLFQRFARLRNQVNSRRNFSCRCLNEGLNFFCSLRRSLREFPDLLRYNRKSLTSLPCPCCLDPGIRASRLVWKAVSSMTPMMLQI